MKKILKNSVLAGVLIALSGCAGAMPKYNSSKSTFIVFKTPTLKYADQGFVSKANSETKVEIYSSGQSVMRLRIMSDQVCMSSLACMSKADFNKKVLASSTYPSAILEHIFNGEPIFGGKNMQGSGNNFTQKIGTINYSVSGGNISFSDSSNGVKIKVRGV